MNPNLLTLGLAVWLGGAALSHAQSIATVDADGVALAAIQGLHRKVEERARNLEQELKHRDAEKAELKRQTQWLEERLATLEHLLQHSPAGH